MKKLSEYELANRDFLSDFYKNIIINENLKQIQKTIIKTFVEYVGNSKSATISIPFDALYEVFISGEYKNVFELGWDEERIKRKYNEDNQPYYEKLNCFKSRFEEAEHIKYASLTSIEDIPKNYFSLKADKVFVKLNMESVVNFIEKDFENIICLKDFSLNYFNSKCDFKEDRFIKDIANWNNVEYLALFKHLEDVKNLGSIAEVGNNIPKILSKDKGWIEILINKEITVENFDSITFNNKLSRKIHGLQAMDKVNLKESGEIHYLNKFVVIEQFCRNFGINLK